MNPDFDDARAALEADGLTIKPCGEAEGKRLVKIQESLIPLKVVVVDVVGFVIEDKKPF